MCTFINNTWYSNKFILFMYICNYMVFIWYGSSMGCSGIFSSWSRNWFCFMVFMFNIYNITYLLCWKSTNYIFSKSIKMTQTHQIHHCVVCMLCVLNKKYYALLFNFFSMGNCYGKLVYNNHYNLQGHAKHINVRSNNQSSE